MRFVPQRIEKQDVQPFQLIERCLRNLAVIGQVSRRPEAVPINLRLPVNQRYWLEARAEYLHRSVDRLEFQLRQAPELVIPVKDVAEHPAQKRGRIRTRI